MKENCFKHPALTLDLHQQTLFLGKHTQRKIQKKLWAIIILQIFSGFSAHFGTELCFQSYHWETDKL